MKTCSIEGCGKPAKGRGWCASHWWRWKNHGDPEALKPKVDKPEFCSVEGCSNPPNGKKGMCNAHYLRQYRHGDPNTLLRSANGSVEQWVQQHLEYDGDGCLTWPFATGRDGRGRINNPDYPQAHRYICFLVNGPPPSDIHEAAHNCGKGHEGCVHPKHLRWATPVENAADRVLHGTQSSGETHHSAKLTQEQVDQIREWGPLLTQRELGEYFGVNGETVGDILRGVTWRDGKKAQ